MVVGRKAGTTGAGSLLGRVVVVLYTDHVPEREVADVAVADSRSLLSRIVEVHSEATTYTLDVDVGSKRRVIRAFYIEQRSTFGAVLLQDRTRFHL